MEFKGTKGKWKFTLHEEGRYFGNFWSDLGNREIRTLGVLCKYASDEENEANAQLIVAAPELLEACIEVLERNQDRSVNKLIPQDILQLKNAINKALGK